jgi:ubiquinone/menaquinone biosynthesis C-methylase UbiE
VTAIDGSPEMIARAARDAQEAGLVLANMVLMDIPRIDVAIMEFARVLTRGGAFVFSLTHPCFFCSDWVHDDQGTKLHKAVRDYPVDAFKEPMPSEEQLQQHPEWQHHRRVPSFIVVRAVLLRADQVVE